MEATKRVYSYDDTLKSFRFGVDYSKSKENTIEKIANLKQEINDETKNGIEYVSSKTDTEEKSQRLEAGSDFLEHFKSFVAGAMFGCAIVIIVSHFLYKMMN